MASTVETAYLCHQRFLCLAPASESAAPVASSVAARLLSAVLAVVLGVVPTAVPPLAPSVTSELAPAVLKAPAPDVVSAISPASLAVVPAAEPSTALVTRASVAVCNCADPAPSGPGSHRSSSGDASRRGFFFVSSASFVPAERPGRGISSATPLGGGRREQREMDGSHTCTTGGYECAGQLAAAGGRRLPLTSQNAVCTATQSHHITNNH